MEFLRRCTHNTKELPEHKTFKDTYNLRITPTYILISWQAILLPSRFGIFTTCFGRKSSFFEKEQIWTRDVSSTNYDRTTDRQGADFLNDMKHALTEYSWPQTSTKH